MEEIWNAIVQILGIESEKLTIAQMVLRSVIVYIAALTMVRIGEKRLLGKNTAFDVILGIIFGSVISRAITAPAEFFPILSAGLVLVLLHWLFAKLSFHFDWFGNLVKGHNRILVTDGEILWDAMRKSNISEKDLMTALRSQGSVAEVEGVKSARLERSGDISVIKTSASPQIIDIQVVEGVQTVRIQIP